MRTSVHLCVLLKFILNCDMYMYIVILVHFGKSECTRQKVIKSSLIKLYFFNICRCFQRIAFHIPSVPGSNAMTINLFSIFVIPYMYVNPMYRHTDRHSARLDHVGLCTGRACRAKSSSCFTVLSLHPVTIWIIPTYKWTSKQCMIN